MCSRAGVPTVIERREYADYRPSGPESGTYTLTVVALPGIVTQGSRDAIVQVREANPGATLKAYWLTANPAPRSASDRKW